jgi:hypothetical protein
LFVGFENFFPKGNNGPKKASKKSDGSPSKGEKEDKSGNPLENLGKKKKAGGSGSGGGKKGFPGGDGDGGDLMPQLAAAMMLLSLIMATRAIVDEDGNGREVSVIKFFC